MQKTPPIIKPAADEGSRDILTSALAAILVAKLQAKGADYAPNDR